MTSMITPTQARRLLTETIKGSPRIRNPEQAIAHAEFIAELVRDTTSLIRGAGIEFPVGDDEMQSAAILHDIGYCFAENGYDHPLVGGEFLRRRGFPRTGKIIESHTYAPERVLLNGYKDRTPQEVIPRFWEQVLIDYASLHAGAPGEVINPEEKMKRFRNNRDEVFQTMIDYAESRLLKEVDEVNSLIKGNSESLTAYSFLKRGDEFKTHDWNG